jgi:HEAT repeat protein
LKNASSPDKKLRKEAVAKLGNFGAACPEVLQALTGALHDADAQVRGEAVLALAKLGPDARPAIPDLEALGRTDPDAKVRDYATRALEKLR